MSKWRIEKWGLDGIDLVYENERFHFCGILNICGEIIDEKTLEKLIKFLNKEKL